MHDQTHVGGEQDRVVALRANDPDWNVRPLQERPDFKVAIVLKESEEADF